jgi:Mce-associated membrane protein
VEVAADRTAHPVEDGVATEPAGRSATEPAGGPAKDPAGVAATGPASEPEAWSDRSQVARDQLVVDHAGGPAGRTRLDHLVVGVLAGLLVIALVGVAVLGQRVAAARNEERLRTEAVHAARQLVVNFTTVDHRVFDKSTKGVLALSAGDFRQQYASASGELEQLVKENKTVSTGKVLYAGVVSFDPDSARVLVVADADVTNVAEKKPQLRTYRLQLDLIRRPGGWRVVDLSFVG